MNYICTYHLRTVLQCRKKRKLDKRQQKHFQIFVLLHLWATQEYFLEDQSPPPSLAGNLVIPSKELINNNFTITILIFIVIIIIIIYMN